MNLKDSFRYMNFLDSLMEKGQMLLMTDSLITNTKEEHLRSKANSEATDEVINDANPSEYNFSANDVIHFMEEILAERETLSKKIAKVKKSTSIDIDYSVSMNKKRQEFIGALSYLEKLKSSEKTTKGFDYKFNEEGNQVKYVYDVKKIVTIDYDRNKVKKLIKNLSKKCDEISTEIDKIMIITEVKFDPKWDFTDTVEDAIQKVIKK